MPVFFPGSWRRVFGLSRTPGFHPCSWKQVGLRARMPGFLPSSGLSGMRSQNTRVLSQLPPHRWRGRSAHARAQVLFYMAENLGLRQAELAAELAALMGATPEQAAQEVELSLERLFHWAASCDKHGGGLQVGEIWLGWGQGGYGQQNTPKGSYPSRCKGSSSPTEGVLDTWVLSPLLGTHFWWVGSEGSGRGQG